MVLVSFTELARKQAHFNLIFWPWFTKCRKHHVVFQKAVYLQSLVSEAGIYGMAK